jgi:hypothetical protein
LCFIAITFAYEKLSRVFKLICFLNGNINLCLFYFGVFLEMRYRTGYLRCHDMMTMKFHPLPLKGTIA